MAINVARDHGDFRDVDSISGAFAKHIMAPSRHQESATLLEEGLSVIGPWRSWELGVTNTALSWVYGSDIEENNQERQLLKAIRPFESDTDTEWAYPPRNEIGLLYLAHG